MARTEARGKSSKLAACEGLCEALAEGVHLRAFGTLRAVWGLRGRRLTREFCEGISRGESSMGSGTRAAVLWVKSGSFGQPKKVQDKGRWSLATTSHPQSPAVRGFPGLWYRRRFSRFRSFSAVVDLQGATVPSSSGVFHRRCELRGFFGVDFASLYQRKGPSEIAVRRVLNFLITRWFTPGYSP